MSGCWLDVHGPEGTRRVALAEGLTRLGGRGADVVLEGIASGELHVWTEPPKALYVTSKAEGTPPRHQGALFEECPLRPGARFSWGPYELVYGGRAAIADLAELEELAPEVGAPVASAGSHDHLRVLGRRVAAGALCEAGMADRKVMKRWQDAVEAGTYDPDDCARELLPEPVPAAVAERLLGRSSTLLRDFLMASRQSGMQGVTRRVRQRTRSLAAFVVVQAGVFVLFALILAACMLVLRMQREVSFDSLLDRVLGLK